ncbi:MAG: hypothetical protein Hens3KO_18320 [Henriciella sp.]
MADRDPKIVVIGAAGAQGRYAVDTILKWNDSANVIAVDRAWTNEEPPTWKGRVELVSHDIMAGSSELIGLMRQAQIVLNFAGPFYKIGPVVLASAIEAGVDYVDICDDVDATEDLLAFDKRAEAGNVRAIIGSGSAPGTTNLIAKAAFQYLGGSQGAIIDISWCAPASDMTRGIFEHVVHCLKTALPGEQVVPEWRALEPRIEAFGEPVGDVEVIRLGHPEPLTLKRMLGVEASLRGGMTSKGLMKVSWNLAREVDAGLSLEAAWQRLESHLAGLKKDAGMSGMKISVQQGEDGITVQSATDISMEQSTAVPAVATAIYLLSDDQMGPGVWPPEILDVRRYFQLAGTVSPGGGGLQAFRTRAGKRTEKIRLRDLFEVVVKREPQ